MAKSTGIVLAAGGLTLADIALTQWDATKAIRVTAATVLASIAAGALDVVLPGLGTGSAVLLLVAAVYKSGPRVLGKLNLLPTLPTTSPNGPVLQALRG